jgi:hypothetical protein
MMVGAALVVTLIVPANALGSSGEITRAAATADWTEASIAGSVAWSGCADAVAPWPRSSSGPRAEVASPPPHCGWIPYATIGPGVSESECASADRDWPDLGEDVAVVWWDGELSGEGTAEFDFANLSLDGVPGKLLCVGVIERAGTGEKISCAPGEPIPPGRHCPHAIFSRSIVFGSALLTPRTPEPEEPASPEEPSTPPVEEEPPGEPEEPSTPPVVGEPPPPSGEVTRATASADWTEGSVAGSYTWIGCANAVTPPAESPFETSESPPPYCAWIPYATIGPGVSESECASTDRDWPDLGEDVTVAWWGGEFKGADMAKFKVPGILLDGASGQLLCLSAIEVAQSDETIPCVPPGPPLPQGWHCPYENRAYTHDLAAALLAAPVTPGPGGLPAGSPALEPSLSLGQQPIPPPSGLRFAAGP